MKTLVRRAYEVCSSDYHLSCELQHLNKVFHEQNDYPTWVTLFIVFKEFQSKRNETGPIATGNQERNNNVKNHLLILPYKSSDAMHIISSYFNTYFLMILRKQPFYIFGFRLSCMAYGYFRFFLKCYI